jgi:hypothetical protein
MPSRNTGVLSEIIEALDGLPFAFWGMEPVMIHPRLATFAMQ